MPTSSKAKRALLSLFDSPQGIIYELGSGWGHLIFPLAKRFPQTHIRAFEGSFIPWWISTIIKTFFKVENLTIVRKDFFTIPLCEAQGVVCYLFPGAMKRLKKKFEEELKPGTFVISNTFAIPGWIPDKVIEVDDLWKSRVYLYRR